MKRIFSLIIIGMLLLSLSACKEQDNTTATPSEPYQKDEQMMDYKEEAKEMTVEAAEEYLSREDADPKAPEYRQAVMAVNSSSALEVIQEAQESKEITPEIQALFDGVAFRFIEGDQFGSAAVQNHLIKLGTYELKEDGYYHFTFYDRTLPQTATNMEGNDHTIAAYLEVLDLLLRDPNIQVQVHQK